MQNLALLKERLDAEIKSVEQTPHEAAIEAFRLAWLGKKGELTLLYGELRSLSPEEKKTAGLEINALRQQVEAALNTLKEQGARQALAAELNIPALDVTLPVNAGGRKGALHPVTLMEKLLLDTFRRMGFAVADGPEIESDFYNFSALNIPEHHPARAMQDSFFIKGGTGLLLRTHTSNIQIHEMLARTPPIRLVAPGRVYRVDNDATHTPMFHQIECVVVDRGISMAHLKGLIDTFLKNVFGSDLKTRFRPSFFPFVEPGVEVDLQCTICRAADESCRVCKGTGWLEIGGAGMIHPNVFESVRVDSERYTGFAFGFGIDRMAMLAYGLPDLRQLFSGNYGFHRQFPLVP